MDVYYFSCRYEQLDWRMRAVVYSNDYLFLFEIEAEDRTLNERFGVKFLTQPRDSFLDIRCTNTIADHFRYELALLHSLRFFLLSMQ